MFTDVDRSISLGFALNGTAWSRKQDTLGMAGVWNEISGLHQAFLAAGGTGITVGDGRLTYSPEQIAEVYYACSIWGKLRGTVDYQFVNHPAYNRERGPAHVFAARLHWEF